jgi:hypothetical protein
MGGEPADDPRDASDEPEQDWFERRRAKKDEKKAKKDEKKAKGRAEKDERAAAKRDERHRSDLEKQRAATEKGNSPEKRMERALKAVRREGLKVALIYAAVDAALAALVVNLLLQVTTPTQLPTTLPWPVAVFDAIVRYTGSEPGPLQTSIVVGLGAGVVVFAAELLVRQRRPIVEQFEDANPEVQEALRTARDRLRVERSSRMAVALYEDVLARLRQTSSVGLVNVPRVFVTILVIVALSFASIQVAVVDLNIRDLEGDDPTGGDTPDSEYEGLQDASGVLGEPEDVSAGQETLNTTLATQGGGDDGSGSSAAAYQSGGFSGAGEVEGQEAGFAEREQLEDAELIREYNLRIRSEDDNE